jgi:dimethylargininase
MSIKSALSDPAHSRRWQRAVSRSSFITNPAKCMKRFEGLSLRHAIVVPPIQEYTLVDDLKRHNFQKIPDRDTAVRQHEALRDLLTRLGVKLTVIPENPGHPNSVFVRDVAYCSPEGAVILNMGLASRRGEEQWILHVFREIGIPVLGGIESPGTVEGGDLVITGEIAFVGSSKRSNKQGVDQMARLLLYMGYRVRIVPVPEKFVHLGGMMTAIAPRRILFCEGTLAQNLCEGLDIIRVPDDGFTSGNVITVATDVVIAEASNTRAIDILKNNGVTVHSVELSAFTDGMGGPSCLILPVDVV